ncbi:putative RCC1 repeat protein [Gregarina niphandrodes]|uniref:RCC1 repeat protein n=1 Tax=Gregarina niphandrodes TaxID=110365 RepID=A0A023AXY9_GRENI|nr:putative RCC1 repeat protein [Gregarina niphandrodes]EZG43509.1 putative RCC1 repeat protein [Gregarina niphandrodes]|eukprot:XP_011133259.1 putative RCC1 repeat protein [Gregarina niphandrodes]
MSDEEEGYSEAEEEVEYEEEEEGGSVIKEAASIRRSSTRRSSYGGPAAEDEEEVFAPPMKSQKDPLLESIMGSDRGGKEYGTSRVEKRDKMPWRSIKRLAFGVDFGLAVAEVSGEPTLYSWGANNNNVLLLGDELDSSLLPERVESLNGKSVFDLSAGVAHAAVVVKTPEAPGGKVYTWGLGTMGRLGYVRDTEEGVPLDPYSEDPWYTERACKVRFSDTKIARVVCGGHFTYFLSEHGQLWVCGFSQAGALGFGEEVECIWAPNKLPIVDSSGQEEFVTQVAAGLDHVLCCCRSGRAYAWGDGRSGRLGLGDDLPRFEPTPIRSLEGESMTYVAAGTSHSAAIDRSERLWVWGSNGGGQLGLEDNLERLEPTLFGSFPRCKAVWLGAAHSLALDGENNLYVWGSGPVTGLPSSVPRKVQGLGDEAVAAASGLASVMVYTRRGDLWAWGRAPLGLLDEADQSKPVSIAELRGRGLVRDLAEQAAGGTSTRVEKAFVVRGAPCLEISSGRAHTLLLTPRGEVWAWGSNSHGQLGTGATGPETETKTDPALAPEAGGEEASRGEEASGGEEEEEEACATEPVPVAFPEGTVVRQVVAAGNHSLCVAVSRDLFAWGAGESGQLCMGRQMQLARPTMAASLRGRVLFAAAGADYTALVLAPRASAADASAGELWVCGNSDGGKLGVPVDPGQPVLELRRVRSVGEAIVRVACGESHMCAITDRGQLFVWGTGAHGRLGTGDARNAFEPVEVKLAGYGPVVDVACGDTHSLAVTQQGVLFVWGQARAVGTQSDLLTPTNYALRLTAVAGDGGCAAVAAAGRNAGCLTRGGKLVLWGANSHRQLGAAQPTANVLHVEGSTEYYGPVWLKQLEAVSAFALGKNVAFAANKRGELFAWGHAAQGRLGLGPVSQTKADISPLTIAWDCAPAPELLKHLGMRTDPAETGSVGQSGAVGVEFSGGKPGGSGAAGGGGPASDEADFAAAAVLAELRLFEAPTVELLQAALQHSFEVRDDAGILAFEADLQHLYGKLIDRVTSAHDTNMFMKSKDQLSGCLARLALALGVSPAYFPAAFDPTISENNPKGAHSKMKDLVYSLRSNMEQFQIIVETLIIQPAYWLILRPFLKHDEQREAFSLLLSQLYHEIGDLFLQTRMHKVLRAIGEAEIDEAKDYNTLFVNERSVFSQIINKCLFANVAILHQFASAILKLSLNDDCDKKSAADLLLTFGTGANPPEFCFFTKTEEELEQYLKKYESSRMNKQPSAAQILRSKVSLRELYEESLSLLEPTMEHLAGSLAIPLTYVELWGRINEKLKEKMNEGDTWYKYIDCTVYSYLSPLLRSASEFVEILGYPKLPERLVVNFSFIAEVLETHTYNQRKRDPVEPFPITSAYAKFEMTLSERIELLASVHPDLKRMNLATLETSGYGHQLETGESVRDPDLRIVISLFTTHVKALSNPRETVRVDWWPLLRVVNLFREYEPKLKALSSFDPLIQAVRALCPPEASQLPISDEVLDMFYEIQFEDHSDEQVTDEQVPPTLGRSSTRRSTLDRAKSRALERSSLVATIRRSIAHASSRSGYSEYKSEVFVYRPAFLFHARSMAFERTTGCAVPQTLAFRQAVHTRKGVAVSSVIRPFSLPDEYDGRTKLIEGIRRAPKMRAGTYDELNDAFVDAHDYAIRSGQPGDLVQLLADCFRLCDTMKRKHDLKELIKYGAEIINNRERSIRYLESLRDVYDQLERYVTDELAELARNQQVNEEKIKAIEQFEVDSTLASITESFDIKPFVWQAIPYMPRRIDGPRKYVSRVSQLLNCCVLVPSGVASAAAERKDRVVFQNATGNSWQISVGNLSGSVITDDDQYPQNYFDRLTINPGMPTFYAGPLKILLNNIREVCVEDKSKSYMATAQSSLV